MTYTLQNRHLRAQIRDLGAELTSLYSLDRDMEYLWQPGYEIWDHSSLLLFPNPGRISRDRTIIDGIIYPATLHGFAKDCVFTPIRQERALLELELRPTAYTRRYFPYEFCLRVVFRLEEDKLVQEFRVSCQDSRTMYFCLGAHPGFYLPLELGESGADYLLRFDRPQQLERMELQAGTSLLTGRCTPYLQHATDIPLREDFFNSGSVLLRGVTADSITLLSTKSGRYVRMGIGNAPYLCLWGNAHKNYMICLEPWWGVSDLADTDHVWETKLGIQSVEPGGEYVRTLTFEVG